MKTPEDYGYKLGENIVPYINKCIDEGGECYIAEGEHVFGRNDNNFLLGHPWSDSCITWGWSRKNNIKIIGAGKDKTIFKLVDKVNSKNIWGKKFETVKMLATNFNESCDNNLIEGITFDGNYENNSESSTVSAINIRGTNNTIKNCRFINFGVGADQSWECFQIYAIPTDLKQKGPIILNNTFEKIGLKKNSKSGHVPENTLIAVGGVDVLVEGNEFINCEFDTTNQQSPIHGISIGETKNAKIIKNKFDKFQGACIYMDSWKNEDALIEENEAKDVWGFINLTCQTWGNENQISFNKNFKIQKNKVELSSGNVYYQHDAPPIVSFFLGYNYDPRLDRNKYPAFENIVASENEVKLGSRETMPGVFQESAKLICFWGAPVTDTKIKVENNNFISAFNNQKQLSLWQRFINWIKNLFS